MATRRWLGTTSGDISTAGNWSGGSVPVSNDLVIFDSSATADALTGAFGTFTTSVSVGPGFTKAIGTVSTAVAFQKRFETKNVTLDFLKGFAHIDLLAASVVIKSCPYGDGLLLDGKAADVEVTSGKGGRITIKADADIGTLVVAPRGDNKDRADVLIEEGAEIDTLVVSGNSLVDMYATSLDNVVISGSNAKVIFRSQTLGASGTIKVNGGTLTIDKTNPVLAASGNIYLANDGVLEFENTEVLALAASGTIDLVNDGLLDMQNVQVLASVGTITSYAGRIRPLTPVTMTVQSDTKLSSTSGRSLDFSVAANSGHVPTVLW